MQALSLAHASHWNLRSLHSVVQMPQLTGHSLNMKAGLVSHWPSWAQAEQLSSLSLHEKEHVPHESGHVTAMNSGLEMHSPSFAHEPQLSLLSLQIPAATRGRAMAKTEKRI